MKIRSVIIGASLICGIAPALQAQDDMPAYALFDNNGNRVTFSQMTDSLGRADVVFIGENHNCPITHWLEFEIARALYERHGDRLTIGEEMMEADNQLLLDEYMKRLISYDRFEAEARLWDNYSTDYYPVVYMAKENAIPFVATNVPRRYAAAVRERGLEALTALSDEAKSYIAPLPIPFEYDERENDEKFGAMRMLRGGDADDFRRLAEAQAVKDATMAWFIARNLRGKFLHINGSFHSDNRGGIIPYLNLYRPGTRVATVTSARQEDISQLGEENVGRADFYIIVPENMTTTY